MTFSKMKVTVESMYRFPVKGLSGQVLNRVELKPGQGFPCDRQFGFARPNSGFDPSDPKPLPKTKFYMLARDAALALLTTEYNDSTGVLSLTAADTSGSFNITNNEGKLQASSFIKAYLNLAESETPELYEASPHRFTDVSVDSTEMMNAISLINLESVEEFSKAIGQSVDPGRFRGNVHIKGLAPFQELDLVGKHISIGDSRLKVVQRTKRCPATEVNLETGERDMKTPKLLMKQYGHMDMGVYAEVVEGSVITAGESVVVL